MPLRSNLNKTPQEVHESPSVSPSPRAIIGLASPSTTRQPASNSQHAQEKGAKQSSKPAKASQAVKPAQNAKPVQKAKPTQSAKFTQSTNTAKRTTALDTPVRATTQSRTSSRTATAVQETPRSDASDLFVTPAPPARTQEPASVPRAPVQLPATARTSREHLAIPITPQEPPTFSRATQEQQNYLRRELGYKPSNGRGPRRHRKILRDSVIGITKPDIRRLARRGGVKRISSGIYQEIRITIKDHIRKIFHDISELLGSARPERKLVTARDVVWALNRQGHTIYGFDDMIPGKKK